MRHSGRCAAGPEDSGECPASGSAYGDGFSLLLLQVAQLVVRSRLGPPGKPIAQVARDLGVNEGTLGNWVNQARVAAEGAAGLSRDDIEELERLRAENAELRMERDVIKRSVVLWVKEATK